MSGKCNLRKNQYTCTCVYMCVNKQPTYNQGKLKLTRYIYWTSPLAKAKGNVWQQQPTNITNATKYNQGKLKLTRYIYWTSPLAKAKGNVWQQQYTNYTNATKYNPHNRCNIQSTYNQRFDGRYYLGG